MRLGRAIGSRLAPAIAVAAALLLLAASSPARSATQPYTGVSIRLHGNAVTPSDSAHDRFPKARLVTAMVPWDALQPSQGSFDWSQLNANVRDAQADGYKLILRLMAGDHAPSWLFGDGASSIRLIQGDVGSRNFCTWTTIPVPWDATLRKHYTHLIRGIGNWMTRSPGGRGVNGDQIHLVSVSMPMWDTAEMTMGYGSDTKCPNGTPAAGRNPRDHNRAAWDALADQDERRRLLEAAWSQAIDIHMEKLPTPAASVIAYGQIFWDDQAAARRLADRKTGQYGSRLWSMYTNLQPSVRRDGSLGPWRERCPSCHEALMAAKARGGHVGFLTAGREYTNTAEKFRRACEDGLSTYGMKFLETSEDKLEAHEGYLIRDRGNLQSRL